MAKSWYAFMGGDNPTSSSSYIQISATHDCLCGKEICAIYAEDHGFYPADPLSPNLQSYITQALVSGQLQPALPLAAKKYVYLKY